MDLYGKQQLIGYTDGKTEFGAKVRMHMYGGNSLITAYNKMEYKAPDMNMIPQSGEFLYTKEKQIVEAKWMDEKINFEIPNGKVGDKLSLFVQTRNYEEGEQITVVLKQEETDIRIYSNWGSRSRRLCKSKRCTI